MSSFTDGWDMANSEIRYAKYIDDLMESDDNKVTAPVAAFDKYTADLEQVDKPMDNPVQHDDGYVVGGSSIDSFLKKLYDVETRGGKIADRKGSNYSGLAQLGRNERTPIINKLGYTEEDYQTSRDVQDEVTRIWINQVKDGISKRGYEPTDLNVWIAHNQGLGGFSQIMRGKVSDTVLKNIRNQAGMDANSTVSDYVKYYATRF